MATAQYDQNQIDQIFQQNLGRAGTPNEHKFLSYYVTNGYMDPYQIGQYLQSTPEALQNRQPGQLQGYQQQLTKNNQAVLGQAADAANASFAQNGRQFSSGQGNSVLQAGQQLAAQQSPMIANFYGNQAGDLNSAYMGQGQSALSRSYGLQDVASQRAYDTQMYQMQRQDAMGMLGTQNRMNFQNGLTNAAFSLPGSIFGAAGQAKGFGNLF